MGLRKSSFLGLEEGELSLEPKEVSDSKYLKLNYRDTCLVGRREASFFVNNLENQKQTLKKEKALFFQRKYFSHRPKRENSQKNYNPKSITRKSM